MKGIFNLDRFKAEIKNKAVAESDKFEIIITIPECLTRNSGQFDHTRLASLYAEQVAFPPLSIFVKQCRIFGPAQQRPITSDYGGDGATIMFLVDRDMKIKSMFDYWMQSVVDKDTHLVAYQEEYRAQIEIRQLDRKNNVVYQCKLTDAFPRSMMQMDMNNGNAGQFHRLGVTFAYHKWKVEQVPASSSPVAFDRNSMTGDQIRNRR